MKCKLDFVTNSSSVSVVMWGVQIDSGEMEKNEQLMKIIKEFAKENGMTDEYLEDDMLDVLYRVAEKEHLSVHHDCDGSSLFIGGSPFDIGDNETGKEYKEKIQEKLKSIGITGKIGMIEESWRDG